MQMLDSKQKLTNWWENMESKYLILIISYVFLERSISFSRLNFLIFERKIFQDYGTVEEDKGRGKKNSDS